MVERSTTEVLAQPALRSRLPLPDFTAFDYAPFRFWWLSSATVMLNQNMTQIILAWMILELTDSAAWVSLTIFAFGLPSFFLLIPAGALADRGNRRRQLVVAQSVAIVNALVLAVVVAAGWISPQLAIVFAIISGITVAMSQPARQSLIPLLVPPEIRTNAVVIGNLSTTMAQATGPAFAGVLIAVASFSVALSMMAILLALGICSLLLMRLAAPDAPSQRRFRPEDLFGGVSFLWSTKPLLVVVALYMAVGMWIGGTLQSLVPVLVRDFYHEGSSALGFAYTMQAISAVSGTLLLTRMGAMRYKGALFGISLVFAGSAVVGYGISPNYTIALYFFFQFGIGTALYQNMSQSILQAHTPQELLGRVFAIFTLAIMGMIPLGALHAGLLASLFGARVVAVYCGLTAVTIGLVAITLGKRFRELS